MENKTDDNNYNNNIRYNNNNNNNNNNKTSYYDHVDPDLNFFNNINHTCNIYQPED